MEGNSQSWFDDLFKDFDASTVGDMEDFWGGEFFGNNAPMRYWDYSGGANEAIFGPGEFRDAMLGEIDALQGAADRQFDRQSEREQQIEDFIGTIQERMERNRIEVKNPREYDFVQRGEQALSQFNDMTAQNISAAASGIRGQMQGAISMVNSGRRPDGTLMTPQEQAQARYQLQGQLNNASSRALTPIVNQHNAQRAAMGFQVAGLMVQAEQLNHRAHQINAANELNALNLELQGRTALAQYTMQNRESVVSLFNGMLQLAQVGMDLNDYRDENADSRRRAFGYSDDIHDWARNKDEDAYEDWMA